MANNIGGNPWVLDTAGVGVIKPGLVYVRAIVFSGYAAATDQAILTANDGRGNRITVATLDGDADLSAQSYNEGASYWLRDLALTTLTSGQVSIFV